MSLAGDNFSVGMYQFVPSLLAYPQFDDLGYSPQNALVVLVGYNLLVCEFQFVPSQLTCPDLDVTRVLVSDMILPDHGRVILFAPACRWVCTVVAPMECPFLSCPDVLFWKPRWICVCLFDGWSTWFRPAFLDLAPFKLWVLEGGAVVDFLSHSSEGFGLSIWQTKGKGKKERLGFSGPSAFWFEQTSFILKLVPGFSGAGSLTSSPSSVQQPWQRSLQPRLATSS